MDDDTAAIAHDLKNPLNVIALEAILLQRLTSELDVPRIDGALARIMRNVQFMNRMISELLDAAAVEAGILQLDRRPTELGGFLAQAIERSVASTERERVCLELGDGVTATVDPMRLERVVANLVQNALKYSPPGSPLVVRLEERHGAARIAVIDAGEGIGEDEAQTVFDRFGRGRAARGIEGTGLGLYVSRRIVEAHGGRIGAESEPGSGARFYVEVPLG